MSVRFTGTRNSSNNRINRGYVTRLNTMKPVSNATRPAPSSTSTVLVWPPTYPAPSKTVSSCDPCNRWAQPIPAMPVPTIARVGLPIAQALPGVPPMCLAGLYASDGTGRRSQINPSHDMQRSK